MTTLNVRRNLSRLLAEAYPKQARNLTSGPVFIRVDDRDSDDTYAGFCDIHLTMLDRDGDQFTLTLDNVPCDDHVRGIATNMDGTWQTTRSGERLSVILSAENSGNIRKLGNAIRSVVGRGKRYLDPNWKWIARRTAISLERLAAALPMTK